MRRTLVFAVILALAAVGLSLTSGVGAQSEGGAARSLIITKVVDGDGPTGGYVVEVRCTDDNQMSLPVITVTFDAAGPDAPEDAFVPLVNDNQECTIQEVETQGADSVTYECVDGDHECLDDRTVDITTALDFSQSSFTVTNVFEADVEPGPPVEPPSGGGDVVTATPPYTG